MASNLIFQEEKETFKHIFCYAGHSVTAFSAWKISVVTESVWIGYRFQATHSSSFEAKWMNERFIRSQSMLERKENQELVKYYERVASCNSVNILCILREAHTFLALELMTFANHTIIQDW